MGTPEAHQKHRCPSRAPGFAARSVARWVLALGVVLGMAPQAWADNPTDPGDLLKRLAQKRRLEAQRRAQRGERGLPAPADADASRKDQASEKRSTGNPVARELSRGLFEAERALQAGRYAEARQHAERVLEGAAFAGGPAQLAKLRSRAEAILARVAKSQAPGHAARRSADVASMRERAHTELATSLRELRDRGWGFHEKGDHAKALAVAQRMQHLSPGNAMAVFLRNETERAREEKQARKTQHTLHRKAFDRYLFEAVEEELTPPPPAKIVLRGDTDHTRRSPVRDRPMPAWELELRKRLAQQFPIEFRDATITDACRYLAELSDSTILVDPVVAKVPKRFTLPKMTLSLEHALRWLCRFWRVTYVVRDHAILVTTRHGRLNRPERRVYDISGLLMPLRSIKTTFQGSAQVDQSKPKPGHELLGTPPPAPGPDDGEKPLSTDLIGKGWADFIRLTVAPESWDGGESATLQAAPRYTIAYRNGRIVVLHTPEVHRQIEELLANYRRAHNLQVHVLARFLMLETDFLEEIGVNFPSNAGDPDEPDDDTFGFIDPREVAAGKDWQRWEVRASMEHQHQIGDIPEGFSQPYGGLSVGYHYLNHTEVNAILTAVIKRRKGSLLLAPCLTCFNTQRANFQALVNYNYVRSISSDEEPEIGNVPDGVIFDIQPFISANHRYVTLVLQPQLRTLEGLQSFSYISGESRDRAVQLPIVVLRSIATTVTVPDGGSLLVGGLTRVQERHGSATIPFFNTFPGLKYILRDWIENERRTSLVVMVTAEIIRDIFAE